MLGHLLSLLLSGGLAMEGQPVSFPDRRDLSSDLPRPERAALRRDDQDLIGPVEANGGAIALARSGVTPDRASRSEERDWQYLPSETQNLRSQRAAGGLERLRRLCSSGPNEIIDPAASA